MTQASRSRSIALVSWLAIAAAGPVHAAHDTDSQPSQCLLVDQRMLSDAFERTRTGDFAMLEGVCDARLSQSDRLLRDVILHASEGNAPRAMLSAKALLETAEASPANLYRASSAVASAALIDGAYADAAHWARIALAQNARRDHPGADDGLRQLERIAASLGDLPAPILASPSEIRVRGVRDKVGLLRLPVGSKEHTFDAIVDTGANVSVVRASLASALGVRRLEGGAEVGSATQKALAVQLGIIDALTVGDSTLRHVPVLILEDEHLTFPVPGGYQIDLILGLPVLKGMRRLEYRDGAFLVGGAEEAGSVDTGSRTALRHVGTNLFVDVHVAGLRTPMHLDTGANSSSLGNAILALRPHLAQRLQASTEHVGGAGGTVVRQGGSWNAPDIDLDGRPLGLQTITIELAEKQAGVDALGTLGIDALGNHWLMDFTQGVLRLPPDAGATTRSWLQGASRDVGSR